MGSSDIMLHAFGGYEYVSQEDGCMNGRARE